MVTAKNRSCPHAIWNEGREIERGGDIYERFFLLVGEGGSETSRKREGAMWRAITKERDGVVRRERYGERAREPERERENDK